MTECQPNVASYAIHPAGALLRAYCRDNGVSMRSLSLSIGRGEKFVADIASGRSRFPDPRALEALSEKTGIPLSMLSRTNDAPHVGQQSTLRTGLFFDAVIAAVEETDTLSDKAKKDIIGDVRIYCTKWFGCKPERLPADPYWLREKSKDWSHQTFGISKKHWSNVRWSRRRALELAKVIPVDRKPIHSVGMNWKVLYDRVAAHKEWLANSLSPFIRYCDAFGISPDAVTNDTVEAYAAYRDAFDLDAGVAKKIQRVRSGWNQAACEFEDWPQVVISAGYTRKCINLPKGTFPTSFRNDIKMYREARGFRGYEAVAGGTHLERARLKHARNGSNTGRKKIGPLRENTLDTHEETLWFAASAMVRLGAMEAEDIHEIADIADVGVADRVVEDIEARLGLETSYAGSVVKILGSIARRWVPSITDEEKNDFSILTAEMNEKAESLGRLSSRDRLRLAPFLNDPNKMGELLALPYWAFEDLETERRKSGAVTYAMALAAQSSIAVLIESTLPVRWGDLGKSAFETNVILPKARGGTGLLHYKISKTFDTGIKDVQAPLSAEKVRLLKLYQTHYLPVLATHSPLNPHLFPGAEPGTAKSYGQLARQVKSFVKDATGHIINANLWRKLMGGYLLYQTRDMQLVRALLGHTERSNATSCYVEFQAAWAAMELDRHTACLITGATRPKNTLISIG